MADEKQKREHGIPIGGVILLFLGVVFLLQTLHIVPWALWGTLWRFWPVIIIIAGLGIILRRYHPWLVSLIILVLLFACLGLAIGQHAPSTATVMESGSYSQSLDKLERAEIVMDFPVGNLSIASLPAGSPNLVESDFKKAGGVLKSDFRREGNAGVLNLKLERADWPFWGGEETIGGVRFARNIPLTMNVKSAVSNLDVDLSELKVTDLKMKLDVGNYKVVLPSSAGNTKAGIDVALSNLDVVVPEGVAIKLKVKASLGSAEIDQSRFPKQGDFYISPNYESARNRVEMELNCDLGRVGVK